MVLRIPGQDQEDWYLYKCNIVGLTAGSDPCTVPAIPISALELGSHFILIKDGNVSNGYKYFMLIKEAKEICKYIRIFFFKNYFY